MTDALGRSSVSTGDMYLQAIEDVPHASVSFAQDAWAHKSDTALHVVKEAVTSYLFGGLIGYVVPAKGPAAAIAGAILTAPMFYSGYKRLVSAAHDLHKNGANSDAVARSLAEDSIGSGLDLVINLGGGYAGAARGSALAKSETFGGPAQWLHQKIAVGENEGIILARSGFNKLSSRMGRANLSADSAASVATTNLSGEPILGKSPFGSGGIVDTNLDQQLNAAPAARIATAKSTQIGYLPRSFSRLGERVNQYSLITRDVAAPSAAQPQEPQIVLGSTHGHSRYSDGMGLPIDLYNKAISEGQQVTTITDHNHLAARGGVKPDDPRAKDEDGTPIIAADPREYVQTQQDAAATTIPGKHVSLYGLEVGTIGSEPHGHGGDSGGGGGHGPGGGGKPRSGGGEAEGVVASVEPTATAVLPTLETPSAAVGDSKIVGPEPPEGMFDQPKPSVGGTADGVTVSTSGTGDPQSLEPFDFKAAQLDSLSAEHLGGPGGVNHINLLEVPAFFEAVRIPKTGFNALFSRLTFGDMTEIKAPDVVKFNDGDYKTMTGHLSQLKDSTGNTPIVTLNHPRFSADRSPSLPDAMRNRDYGRKSFANDDEWRSEFVLPFVRGIELIKGGALTPHPVDEVPVGNVDLASYVGYLGLGVEAGPLFGRDFHFGDPVGNPGSTGFLVDALDKPQVLDALRQRRTIATTNGAKLSGYLMANDKFYMGSILDQSAVPELSLKMKVGGEIDPNAQYTLKLYGDDQVLDGKDAAVIQSKQVSGQQLLDANSQVSFDPITHKEGNNSLYFAEVARADQGAAAGNAPLKMWTAPIWVRPLVGDSHGLLARFTAGSAAQVASAAKDGAVLHGNHGALIFQCRRYDRSNVAHT